MRFKSLFILPFLVISMNSLCQISGLATAEYILKGKIINGDTLPHIYVKEIIIFPDRVFETKREVRRYGRLVKNVKVALPYAKIANNTLAQINDSLLRIEDEKSRRKYINKMDKFLRDQYEDELKKLTISQGRILIKLIDRETGNTSYYLVKELKGNFSAFLWQSLARLFGEDLKDDYDEQGEDKLIEEIIILIENGQL